MTSQFGMLMLLILFKDRTYGKINTGFLNMRTAGVGGLGLTGGLNMMEIWNFGLNTLNLFPSGDVLNIDQK
jgi:hypothetical protein